MAGILMQSQRPSSIAELLRPAVVAILDHRDDVFGTGFFITPDGCILTCYHVIERYLSGNTVIIKTFKGDKLTAVFDESKSCTKNDIDFAILKVKTEAGRDYPCLPLGKECDEGDNWCTLGYNFPLTYGSDYDKGTIFSKPPRVGQNGYNIRLKCDLPIRGGSSGSPLLAMKSGSVIGIINSRPDDEGCFECFATPIQDVLSVWSELEKLNSDSPSLIRIPPVKPTIERPHQIPAAPRDFTGREEELGNLIDRFNRGEVIVGIRGLGGKGKTALAFRLAEMLHGLYSDGQIMVNLQGTSQNHLSPVDAMAQVIRSFDRTTSLPESEPEMANMYRTVLNSKHVLLLLDNALDDRQIRPLVPPSSCGLIITSRKKFTVPGMKEMMNLDVLKPWEARELLIKICERIGDQADELAKLCGYLPLALRAAGSFMANTDNIEPTEYIDELRSERTRLERLGSEGVDLDVAASFNLSYSRLPADTARTFRMASVFPADFDARAEVAVCQDERHKSLNDLVKWSLVDYRSLEGVGRYRLHDLARAFSAKRLEMDDDEKARFDVYQRFAEYYSGVLSDVHDLDLQGGENSLAGIKLFDLEWPNIRAGQAWAENIAMQADITGITSEMKNALSLCSSYSLVCIQVLSLRLHPREQIRWLKTALDATRKLKDRGNEGVALGGLGNAYDSLDEYRKAIEFHEQSLAIARQIGDQQKENQSLSNLGHAYDNLGEYHKAIEFYEQARAIARQIEDQLGEGNAIGNMGNAYYSLGDYRKSIECHEKHLQIAREIGNRRGEGAALGNQGNAYYGLGEYRKAIEFYEKSLPSMREIGNRQGEGANLGNLGLNHYCLGEYRKAIEFYQQSITTAREIGNRLLEGNAIGNLGLAYYGLGEYRKAIEFHEKHLAIAREIGNRLGEGQSLGNIGLAYYGLGEYRKAIEFHEKHLAIAREIGNRLGEGQSLGNIGNAYCGLSEYIKAIEFHEKHLAIVREIRNRRGEGNAFNGQGMAYYGLGEYYKAIEFYKKALAFARETENRKGEGNALWNMSLALDKIHETPKAIDCAKSALCIYEQIESPEAGKVQRQLAEWQN